MRHIERCVVLLLLVIGAAASAAEEFPQISPTDLKAEMAGKKVVLIDANGPKIYARKHIPGAIDYESVKDLAKVLPADKSALIVVYCGSERCPKYKGAAEAIAKLGYANVKHFAPGISGWVKSGEPVEHAAAEPALQPLPPAKAVPASMHTCGCGG